MDHAPSCHSTFARDHLFECVPYVAQLTHNLPIDFSSNIISSKHPFLPLQTRLCPMIKILLILWIILSGICQRCIFILVCVVISIMSLSVLVILPNPQYYIV